MSEQMASVLVRKFLKLSHITKIFFEPRFLAHTSWVMLSEDSPLSKKLGDKELKLF